MQSGKGVTHISSSKCCNFMFKAARTKLAPKVRWWQLLTLDFTFYPQNPKYEVGSTIRARSLSYLMEHSGVGELCMWGFVCVSVWKCVRICVWDKNVSSVLCVECKECVCLYVRICVGLRYVKEMCLWIYTYIYIYKYVECICVYVWWPQSLVLTSLVVWSIYQRFCIWHATCDIHNACNVYIYIYIYI